MMKTLVRDEHVVIEINSTVIYRMCILSTFDGLHDTRQLDLLLGSRRCVARNAGKTHSQEV